MTLYCNPLDSNSTLNMDNGSGGLPNKTNKARDFSKKRNFIKPPTTKVHPIMDRGGIKSSRAKWTTAKVLPWLILFVISRITDVITTLLSVKRYGVDLELSSINRSLLQSNLFIPYQALIALILVLIVLKHPNKIVMTVLKVFTVLSLVVSVSNLIIYFI